MILGESRRHFKLIHFDDVRYSIEEVMNWLPINDTKMNKNQLRREAKHHPEKIQLRGDFHGANVSRYSDRYDCFRKNGCVCQHCGLKGTYFRIDIHEKDIENQLYHFNLYGVNEEGNEVLITKDHIKPKSKGGKNYITNYQTLCFHCNRKKGNK